MKENGFCRKSNSWYKSTEECVVLLNLQHSSWSSLYYINLACFLRKSDNSILYPKEYHCHIRTRIPQCGANGESYAQTTNLESCMTDNEREKGIISILNDYCIPTLSKLSSVEGIKQLYKEQPNLNYANPFNSLGINKELTDNK